MDLSSHQQGQIPIPIPINISYGGGAGHEHMIHNHHHHHQHHHDLAATAAAEAAVLDPIDHNHHSNLIHSSAVPLPVVEPSNMDGFSMPTSLDHHHDQHPIPDHHHEGREEEEHVTNILHYNSCKKDAGGLVAPAVGSSIKYKECLKNHAAAMGGTATDGCGEFMPSGQQGSLEALTCAACHCHRNFHRKQVEGEQHWDHTFHQNINRIGRKLLLSHGHHKNILAPPSSHHQPHQIMSNYNMGMGITGSLPPSECDELEDQDHHHGGGARHPVAQKLAKKRFRTKFTQDQKAKMFDFAEKVGWKIQKQEDTVIQQFCQEVGVRRRVLKIWMHNNKHNLAKKNPPPPPA